MKKAAAIFDAIMDFPFGPDAPFLNGATVGIIGVALFIGGTWLQHH